MMRLLFILLAFYPYALSAPAEVQRGGVYTVTVSAPEAVSVNLVTPAGMLATLIDRQGETVVYRLDVAADAPLSRMPSELLLVVDGVVRARAPVRVWTEEVRRFDVWLPLMMRKE